MTFVARVLLTGAFVFFLSDRGFAQDIATVDVPVTQAADQDPALIDQGIDPNLGPQSTLPVITMQTADEQPLASGVGAVLRVLDRVAAQTVDLILPINSSEVLGKITVRLDECRYLPSDPSANAYAHVTVTDPAKPQSNFSAWMIASSPALSALDHPRYDVWVVRCILP
ncbi:MAG: DUF2155 domain-containing protein [Paracoccaceae bacterium]|nr:DUF2155 domain-containing protein [Paracoccaceae bacterium]